MAILEITGYQLQIVSGDQSGKVRAGITLSDAKGTIGHLAFVEGIKPPASNDNPPVLYFPIERYADAVDMLRNEAPVYLTKDASQRWAITTKAERTGEGEGAARPLFPFKPI